MNISIQVSATLYLKDPTSSEIGLKILTEGIQLMQDLGFEAFTFKKLAQNIQSTEATIYRYFENKHNFLLYLINWYWGILSYRLMLATANVPDHKQQLSNFEIKCLVLKHTDEECLRLKDKTYQEEIEYLITHETRNKFIKNLAVSLGKNTLILFQMVDKHGRVLYDMIKNTKNIGNRKIFFVYGGTETTDREEIRKIMDKQ
jgi:AcrR family transcriptional regulator